NHDGDSATASGEGHALRTQLRKCCRPLIAQELGSCARVREPGLHFGHRAPRLKLRLECPEFGLIARLTPKACRYRDSSNNGDAGGWGEHGSVSHWATEVRLSRLQNTELSCKARVHSNHFARFVSFNSLLSGPLNG